jgi:Uncharacterized protein conserved in bacteria
MGDLSKNFNRYEFICKGENCCGGSAPISLYLIAALEDFRLLVGKPVHILSGFRCITHNRNVDGATLSHHCLGEAADIIVDEFTPLQLVNVALKIPRFYSGGIGIYSTFVHLDVRLGASRWSG